MNLQRLQELVRKGKYEWKKHILVRLAERNISQKIVIDIVLRGEIIEEYPKDHPFPSCLMLGWFENKPYHVVISLDDLSEIVYFITVYEPSLDEFESDFKTRRK